MSSSLRVSLTTFLFFGLYFILDDLYFKEVRSYLYGQFNQFGVSHIISYAIFGLPILVGIFAIHRKIKVFDFLGLNAPILKGFLFSLICTLPMFIGFFFVFDFNSELSLDSLLITVLAAAIFEEVYFRGFLFGQLYRYSNLGFVPSVLFGALLFGLMHLYQSTEFAELVGIFLVTFLGGILFAWLYVEWDFNLWVPIFLHLLMNLSWDLFSVSDNAFGGIYSNVFRIVTIALAITLTILYKKKRRRKLEINKKTIWMKKTDRTQASHEKA